MKLHNVNMLKYEKKNYISRSLISQFNVSHRKSVAENRKRDSFHETFYKKTLVKLTYPGAQARVLILLISNSALFCFFLVSKSEL